MLFESMREFGVARGQTIGNHHTGKRSVRSLADVRRQRQMIGSDV